MSIPKLSRIKGNRRWKSPLLLMASAAVLLLSIYALPSTQSAFRVGVNPLSSHEREIAFFENGSAALPLNFIREGRGMRSVECLRRDLRRTSTERMERVPVHFGGSTVMRGFPRNRTIVRYKLFSNSFIISRRVILNFMERKDGAKSGIARSAARGF